MSPQKLCPNLFHFTYLYITLRSLPIQHQHVWIDVGQLQVCMEAHPISQHPNMCWAHSCTGAVASSSCSWSCWLIQAARLTGSSTMEVWLDMDYTHRGYGYGLVWTMAGYGCVVLVGFAFWVNPNAWGELISRLTFLSVAALLKGCSRPTKLSGSCPIAAMQPKRHLGDSASADPCPISESFMDI